MCTVFAAQVYCICHQVHREPHLGVLHLPSSNIRCNTGVYCISHQVYCRCHAVRQEPNLGVQHILACTVFENRCSEYDIIYIRIPPWVYCICHHLTSGASLACTAFAIKCTVEKIVYSTSGAQLGCTAFAIKCTAYPIMFIRSLTLCTAPVHLVCS